MMKTERGEKRSDLNDREGVQMIQEIFHQISLCEKLSAMARGGGIDDDATMEP
jgi:hypothetical protein